MKVLMTGPAKGHNIKRFLRWFHEHHDLHGLDFLQYNKPGHYDLKRYNKVHFIRRFSVLQFMISIRASHLIWVHNWTPWPYLLLIILIKPGSTMLVFNFWSEKLPRRVLNERSILAWFYRYFFNRCDYLQCTWHSVKRWVDQIKESRSVLLRWGFEREYFEKIEEAELESFTVEFMESLPKDKIKYFVPKSLGFPNRHDLMIQAASLLKQRGEEDFIIYFWKGNYVSKEREETIAHMIEEKNVQNQVKIVNHPFLPNMDLMKVWSEMDVGLQICDEDQLSTAFTEPQLFKKHLIASKIFSYEKYNEEFKLNIPLVENKAESIAEAMLNVKKHPTEERELERRKRVIAHHFHFEQNITKMMELYNTRLKEEYTPVN